MLNPMNRPISRVCLLIALAAIAFSGWCHPAFSQDRPKKGPAFTEPPADDDDFPLLGEFVGPVSVGENEFEAMGLQVRPIGDGSFEAVAYRGGLPGQKGHRPDPTQLIGRRAGERIVLSGHGDAIFVSHDRCVIVTPEGDRRGRLERVVRHSPTLGAPPPEDAVVIFDGSDTEQVTGADLTEEGWLTEGGLIRPMFQDFNLHLEYRIPYMPVALEQARGNSGVYLQSRYECQVLDSFATEPLVNGHGALYRFRKPDVNMSFPPLAWQTYDIAFTAPRWAADGTKTRNARITAWVNGVKVHDNVEIPDKTGAGKAEEPVLLPTRLQDHGDPVRFRNVWAIDRGLAAGAKFPVYPPKEKEGRKDGEKAKADKSKSDVKDAKKDRDAKKEDAKKGNTSEKSGAQPNDSGEDAESAEEKAAGDSRDKQGDDGK